MTSLETTRQAILQLQQLLEVDTITHILDDEYLLEALQSHLERKLAEVEQKLQFEQQKLMAISQDHQRVTTLLKHITPLLDQPIENLNLNPRVLNPLIRQGIVTTRLLLRQTEEDLLLIHNLGEKGVEEIKNSLATHGWQLSQPLEPEPLFSWLVCPSWEFDPLLDEPLENLRLSQRVENALIRAGLFTPRLLLLQTQESLLQEVTNLGEKSLDEIKEALEFAGWQLPIESGGRWVQLSRLLMIVLGDAKRSLPIDEVVLKIQTYNNNQRNWSEQEIFQVITEHPYIALYGDNSCQLFIQPILPPPNLAFSPIEQDTFSTLDLAPLWDKWVGQLNEHQRKVLFLRFAIFDGTALTLEQVAKQIGLTRERIRQIEQKGLDILGGRENKVYWQRLKELLKAAVDQHHGLLVAGQWINFFEKHTSWQGQYTRPNLLPLLCALFSDEYRFLNNYQAVVPVELGEGSLRKLNQNLKQILASHKNRGLPLPELIAQLPAGDSPFLQDPVFVQTALELFESFDQDANGRVYYRRKPKPIYYASSEASWPGQEGTKLYEWEQKLRAMLPQVAWLGQLPITEAQFFELAELIRTETQSPNLQSKIIEGNPRMVPAAVFMVSLVFSARYTECLPDEAPDEFWTPYLRTVWHVPYSQAFGARCSKRFQEVRAYLEHQFQLKFPRHSEGDKVTPIYRHALVPRYLQADFAQWLGKNWQNVLDVAYSPALLMAQLRNEPSLNYYSQRLKAFIQGQSTAETAAHLISNMASALSLYLLEGETVENITHLLEDTPIEKELWQEIAQEFVQGQQKQERTVYSQPRVSWLWVLDEGELALRVQNWLISPPASYEGIPAYLLWNQQDELLPPLKIEVNPWRLTNGQWLINDLILSEPEGKPADQLALYTDYDELLGVVPVPAWPMAHSWQLFRLSQQGAYGIPIRPEQLTAGVWYITAERPLTLTDEDGDTLAPDVELSVPEPLTQKFNWAAQFTLSLPLTITDDDESITLTENNVIPAVGKPLLTSDDQIQGLSHQVQPTFASTHIQLVLEYGPERLLKQSTLWLEGQDGWKAHYPLQELQQQGHLTMAHYRLVINLAHLLPADRPNLYTIQLRQSLQPILLAPLELAVVPQMVVEQAPAADDPVVYTPVNTPQVILRGLAEENIVSHPSFSVATLPDQAVSVRWSDLRHEPRLVLRFGRVEIPLGWSVPRFMAWLEPKPTQIEPFLTLEELQKSTLHVLATSQVSRTFALLVSGQPPREVQLNKSGRYKAYIAHDQLSELWRPLTTPQFELHLQLGSQKWLLAEVRQRPVLNQVAVAYDTVEKNILFTAQLPQKWAGQVVFRVESLTNPFARPQEIAHTSGLEATHILPAELPSGRYQLLVWLDGRLLPLLPAETTFQVGTDTSTTEREQQLTQEIRRGSRISPPLMEDFIYLWAELAEKQEIQLTHTTLFQLATIQATALQNFSAAHLKPLWPPLATLQKIHHKSEWVAEHGLLPAWAILSGLLFFKTELGFSLKVYPLKTAEKGRTGVGYARWRLSTADKTAKTELFVTWQVTPHNQIHLQAGIPAEDVPDGRWAEIDILDCYGLLYCVSCGRLTGAKAHQLPAELLAEHTHGKPPKLLDITVPAEHPDGYNLLAELIYDRRGEEIYTALTDRALALPTLEQYLPEPLSTFQPTQPKPLQTLRRELIRLGPLYETEFPLWGGAGRVLAHWQQHGGVTELAQACFALGILLRTAAYKPALFQKLAHETALTEADIQQQMAELNSQAPAHLEWGLIWAELLMIHSPNF